MHVCLLYVNIYYRAICIDVPVGLELNQQRDARTTEGRRKYPPLAITQYNNKDCLIYSLFMYTSREEGEKDGNKLRSPHTV